MSDSGEEMKAIYFTDEQYSRAERLAEAFGTTAQELITSILEEIINNLEVSEGERTKALESLRKFKLAGEGEPLAGDELPSEMPSKAIQEAINDYHRQRANEKYLGTGLLERSEDNIK